MKNIAKFLVKKIDNQLYSQRGITMIEYVLIAAAVAGVIIGVFATLEGGITAAFTTINNALTGQ